jgi:hypothetical protein
MLREKIAPSLYLATDHIGTLGFLKSVTLDGNLLSNSIIFLKSFGAFFVYFFCPFLSFIK